MGLIYSPNDHQTINTASKGLTKIGLEYTANCIYFNGEPIYFWSGEFPYYRLPAAQWSDRLDKINQAGVKYITVYIPWNLHEYGEGKFDFTGSNAERTNLVKLINMLKEKDMYLIPKPGPFMCGEVQHGGIPDWLTKDHPEVIMKDQYGVDVGFRQDGKPLPDYLHPGYYDYVKKWYSQLSADIIVPNQYPAGPVVAVQVENEIPYSTSELANPFSWGYTRETIELYRNWLGNTYKSIDNYNRLHGTNFAGYSAIAPPEEGDWQFESRREWLKFQDWVVFKDWYGGSILGRYGKLLTDAGVTVPMYHNAGMLEDEAPMSFGALASEMWLGVNFWLSPHPIFSLDSYTQGIRRLKQLKASQPDRPNIAPELNWGWGNDKEFAFLTRYTLPFLKGTNIYTIVDGDSAGKLNGQPYSNNPEPFPGSAPISANGSLRPAYGELRRLTRYLENENLSFLQAEPFCDIALGFYAPYNYFAVYQRWGKQDESYLRSIFATAIGANDYLQDFMKQFILNDIDHDVINVQNCSEQDLAKHKLVIVLAQQIMDSATQTKLIRYLEGGGKLILFPNLPEIDLSMQAASILREKVFPDLNIVLGKYHKMPDSITWKGYAAPLNGAFVTNTFVKPGKNYVVRAVDSANKPVAVEKQYGKGKAILIGTYIPDGKFLDWLITTEGITSKYAYSNQEAVEVVALGNKSSRDIYLFLMNRTDTGEEVTVTCIDPFDGNRSVQMQTAVSGQSCSIIRINRGNLVSATLNGDSDTYVKLGNYGVMAEHTAKLDVSWRNKNELHLWSENDTEITLDFSLELKISQIEIRDDQGGEVSGILTGNRLKLKYAVDPVKLHKFSADNHCYRLHLKY